MRSTLSVVGVHEPPLSIVHWNVLTPTLNPDTVAPGSFAFGGFIVMLVMFGTGYLAAWFFRKLWI